MVADKIRADAEAARIESEWKFAAMVSKQEMEEKICFLGEVLNNCRERNHRNKPKGIFVHLIFYRLMKI